MDVEVAGVHVPVVLDHEGAAAGVSMDAELGRYTQIRLEEAVESTDGDRGPPVLAAAGGVFFMAESVSFRLIASSSLILGGIFLAIFGKAKLAEA